MVALDSFLQVVLGVIKNIEGHILITKRPQYTSMPGFWELPGGKIESHETAEIALARELKEELGIYISSCKMIKKISYPEKQLFLNVALVSEYEGEPRCLEGQQGMAWISQSQIKNYQFIPTTAEFISYLFSI